MGKPSKTLSIKNLYLMRDKFLKEIRRSKFNNGTDQIGEIAITAFIEYVNTNRNS